MGQLKFSQINRHFRMAIMPNKRLTFHDETKIGHVQRSCAPPIAPLAPATHQQLCACRTATEIMVA
jgi:hypothetical protein